MNGEAWLQSVIAGLPRTEGATWTVIDVGANRGQWTRSMLDAAMGANSAGSLRLVAVEPVPGTAAMLRAALQRESLAGQVEIVEAAISSDDGVVQMFVSEPGAGTNSMYHSDDAGAVQAREVRALSLDSLSRLSHAEQIDFIKVDAEGHDYAVIEGGRSLLSEGRVGVLQFEYNHRWILARRYLRDVFGLVEDLPYSVGIVAPGRLRLFPGWHPELERFFEANYVLVRSDLIDSIPHSRLEWTRNNVALRSSGPTG